MSSDITVQLRNVVEIEQCVTLADGRRAIGYRLGMWGGFFVAALVLTMVACTDETAPDDAPTPIGVDGGVVTSADGVLTVDIPEGALTETIDVSITVSNDAQLPAGYVGSAYEVAPHGVDFAVQVALTMNYSTVDLGAIDPEALQLSTIIEGAWVTPVMAWNDGESATLGSVVPHFSYWAAVPAPGTEPSFEPCKCDAFAYETCCRSFSGNVKGDCICHWRPPFPDWYQFSDCYEMQAGFELAECTKAERDCCEAWGGFISSDRHDSTAKKCRCSRTYVCSIDHTLAAIIGLRPCAQFEEEFDEFRECWDRTEECDRNSSTCERYATGVNNNECGDVCTDTWTDPENCGACGNVCMPGGACQGGQCDCPAGTTGCPSGCIADLSSNRLHCGQCERQCGGNEVCESGECGEFDCNSPQPPCAIEAHGQPCCNKGACGGGEVSCRCHHDDDDEGEVGVWTCSQG